MNIPCVAHGVVNRYAAIQGQIACIYERTHLRITHGIHHHMDLRSVGHVTKRKRGKTARPYLEVSLFWNCSKSCTALRTERGLSTGEPPDEIPAAPDDGADLPADGEKDEPVGGCMLAPALPF